MSEQKRTIYLKDYSSPDFFIEHTRLKFELFNSYALVRAELRICRNENTPSDKALRLNGVDLELLSIAIDGEDLAPQDYLLSDNLLTLTSVPDNFVLSTVVRTQPQNNTSLEGLYRSRTMFCTQCEAEGFRKITYYLDRPDVMSEFVTTVEADKSSYPVLLSNGNCIAREELAEGRHSATWHDPHLKPAYLFALVAGDLQRIDDSFTTSSGRDVALQIFVEPKDLDKCDHAMLSLKNSMRWDEEVYGREYDLDIFMIVAVDDFNMGAMENKGLNVFNTSCVLAHSDTTTDAAFQRVEGVVAHEYFHNWSGNRVTCRDWFQLSLKEGFTVFRDAMFSADMGSPTVKRVEDVSMLRSAQFAEDASPMAHAVRPASFIEISNFYTLTVYEKGAEVVRMLHTLLGPDVFRQGSDLYFDRHDGQAVTTDDFIAAMADASGLDLQQFTRWYSQAGTPELSVRGHWDETQQRYTLSVKQYCPVTPESSDKLPFHIPLRLALLGEAGAMRLQSDALDLSDTEDNTEAVVSITEREQHFVFEHLPEKPVPSLLRGFSAPVKLEVDLSDDDLLFLLACDNDGFARWDAGQQLMLRELKSLLIAQQTGQQPALSLGLLTVLDELLNDTVSDPAMLALMLALPTQSYLGDMLQPVSAQAVYQAREVARVQIACAMEKSLLSCYQRLHSTAPYQANAQQIARRSLRNTCLTYLSLLDGDQYLSLAWQQFEAAENMTDVQAALSALVNSPNAAAEPLAQRALESFYAKWQHESLVVNQWLQLQAASQKSGGLARVKALLAHPAYDENNPNKLRAVVGAFAQANLVNFHATDGSGYEFLAEQVIATDKRNPQMASRLLNPLVKWQVQPESQQGAMLAALKRIAQQEALSPDVTEVVGKALQA